MTQEEKKNLLLKDLCARLPYGVKANSRDGKKTITITPIGIANFMSGAIDIIKPYLRPMSSMTEEEQKEYHKTFRAEVYGRGFVYVESIGSFDWLNKYNFDYRGLIPLGLALEAPEGMYNN